MTPANAAPAAATLMTEEIPLSLYLHTPWCVSKCPYCDFNSHVAAGAMDEPGYIRALLADLDLELARPEHRPLRSIFIGGGTPSLFGGAAITALLEGVAERLRFAADIEITLEANPESIEPRRLAAYRTAGVNRLSIGVQSFDDALLRALGRAHGADQARRAIAVARDAGFDTLNLDLMYGLPGQTADRQVADLEHALDLGVPHLSLYQLTLEPRTAFFRNPPALPVDDQIAAMEAALLSRTAAAGFARYEVSAYAKPGHRSAHNLNYWTFGDYLGIGAGAHGKRTLGGSIERTRRVRDPARYLAAAGASDAVAARDAINPDDAAFEFLLNALRLTDGFDTAQFTRRTGCAIDTIAKPLAQAHEFELLEPTPTGYRTTPRGLQLLNELLELFLPDYRLAHLPAMRT